MPAFILATIAAGGLVGAADQYACLLVVGLAARFGLITLDPAVAFMGTDWFILLAGLFWVISIAPAYATLLSPGVMNAVNAAKNFLSSFVVPLSAALVALASAGVIASVHPELRQFMDALQFFNPDGTVGAVGVGVAGVSGLAAFALTGMKALAKPAVSASTGTTGTVSAPIFATLESLAAPVLLALAYALMQADPRLLVALFAVVTLALAVGIGFAVYQLWRLQRGIGRVLALAHTHPKAGLAVAAEFFVWGAGWLAWGGWGRGVLMLLLWVMWWAVFLALPALAGGMFLFFPPLIPVAVAGVGALLVAGFALVGLNSARALLGHVEASLPALAAHPAG